MVALGALVTSALLSSEKAGRTAAVESVEIADREAAVLEPPATPDTGGDVPPRKPIDVEAPVERGPLEPSGAVAEGDVPSGRLQVRVVDPWNRPVPGAEIGFARADGSGRKLRLRGDILAYQLPLGVAYRVEASANPLLFEAVSQEPVFVESGEITLQLPAKGTRLSGRVVAAESGEPLDGAGLIAMVVGEEDTYALTREILPEGAFDFLMTAGQVELRTSAAGREPEVASLLLVAGDWISNLEIRLSRAATYALAGRVVDETGRPVGGAEVVSASLSTSERGGNTVEILDDARETATDREGRFRVDGLSHGDQLVRVAAVGFEPTERFATTLQPGENEVEVVLARAGRIRVRAFAFGGPPVAAGTIRVRQGKEDVLRLVLAPGGGARVDRVKSRAKVFGIPIRPSDFPEKHPEFTRATREDGWITVEGVAPGSHEVFVEAGPLEGRGSVFVVAGETATAEVAVSPKR